MHLRTAYTALVLQFPPFITGMVGAIAAFVASAVPGNGLRRVGAASLAYDGGARVGVPAGGAAAVIVGLLLLLGLAWTGAARGARWRAATGMALAALTTPAGVVIGALVGATLGGDLPFAAVWPAVSEGLGLLWPAVAAPAAMAVAIGLTAR